MLQHLLLRISYRSITTFYFQGLMNEHGFYHKFIHFRLLPFYNSIDMTIFVKIWSALTIELSEYFVHGCTSLQLELL